MPLDVQKFNVKGCYRILEHSIRYNGKDVNYANKDIDRSRTSENYHVGIERNNVYGYLKDTVKQYDTITPPKRVKKDRVVMTGFCFTVPSAIANTNKEQEYFQHCYDWLKKQFGEDNIITADVHRDEIHTYWDNQQNKWVESRAHMHAEIIPWTQERGVNCKNFMNRDSMKFWHSDLDRYIYEHMGIHDLTYTESKSLGRDTDMLKKESIEAQTKMVKELNKQVNQIKANEGNLEQREQIISEWQDELQEREQSLAEIEQDVNSREDELIRRKDIADAEVQRQDTRIQSAKSNADKQIQAEQQRVESAIKSIQTDMSNMETELSDAQKRFRKVQHKLNSEYDELVRRNDIVDSKLNDKIDVLNDVEQMIADHINKVSEELPGFEPVGIRVANKINKDIQRLSESLDDLDR